MRKWKGKPGPGQGSVVQAAAAAGTEELLEHIAEAASAGEHEATGGHGRHSAMSFASESSLAPASTRASRPSRALESARQSAAEREGERAAFLKAEMEGRLPRGTVAALAAGWDGASSVGEPAQAPASHEGWGAFDLAFLKTLCPPGWRAYRSSTTQMIYWSPAPPSAPPQRPPRALAPARGSPPGLRGPPECLAAQDGEGEQDHDVDSPRRAHSAGRGSRGTCPVAARRRAARAVRGPVGGTHVRCPDARAGCPHVLCADARARPAAQRADVQHGAATT
jgi:hypothetical protein